MNILVCYGTRPELIKLKLLLAEFKKQGIPFKTLCVKQHTSLLDASFTPDYTLDVPTDGNRLDNLLGASALMSEKVWQGVEQVLVQGDTATALSCALAAFHRNIPVIHLEAGLRTYDKQNPYPEEVYRQLITRVATYHLCPTLYNEKNLLNDGVKPGWTCVTGNTGLDSIAHLQDKTVIGKEVLITLHRRENHPIMHEWFTELNSLAKAYSEFTFTLPLHPNPNVQKHKALLTHVNVVEPMEYEEFALRLARCFMVVTDSGGIQEESAFLGKRCIVCRKVTERKESVGLTSFLCLEPWHLFKLFGQTAAKTVEPCYVFGRGDSCQKISRMLRNMLC